MKKTYWELKNDQQERFGKFPCFFAFSKDQLAEGMAKLGVTEYTDLYKAPGGMFYRKTDSQQLKDLLHSFDDEMQEAYKDDDFLKDAIMAEMGNHEYCYTMDDDDVLCALSITRGEVESSKRMFRIWQEARREYLDAI